MKEYKVVPCQGRIVAKKSEDIQREMLVYANVIAQETVGGWYLVSSMPVTALGIQIQTFGFITFELYALLIKYFTISFVSV